MLYDASLMGDDVPCVLTTPKGEVICLPSHWGMDDWPHYMHSLDFHYTMTIKSPDEAMRVFDSEFEAMYENGGMLITVWHPFVSGQARPHAPRRRVDRGAAEEGRRLVRDDGGDREPRARSASTTARGSPGSSGCPTTTAAFPEWEPQEVAPQPPSNAGAPQGASDREHPGLQSARRSRPNEGSRALRALRCASARELRYRTAGSTRRRA